MGRVRPPPQASRSAGWQPVQKAFRRSSQGNEALSNSEFQIPNSEIDLNLLTSAATFLTAGQIGCTSVLAGRTVSLGTVAVCCEIRPSMENTRTSRLTARPQLLVFPFRAALAS